MLVLVAAPTVTVFVQSLFAQSERSVSTTEICGPFGCVAQSGVSQGSPVTGDAAKRFVGFSHYRDRAHLAFDQIRDQWQSSPDFAAFIGNVAALPFYGALFFTLMYTLLVTPLAILLGLGLACCIKNLAPRYRAPIVFITLLPMVVTPLMGALTLFWMLDTHAILGTVLRTIAGNDTLSVRSSTPLSWLVLIIHGIWQSAPLAFVVYYAGLHTVPRTLVDSARVDGASRWQTLRYVTLPYLLPMTVFLVLVQVMDNFRVLDPVIGFSTDGFVRSLSFNVYADLQSDAMRVNSAATTSALMIVLLALLMTPVLLWLIRHKTQNSLKGMQWRTRLG